MNGLLQFLDMGGYGVFVWPSFIATAAVMGGLIVTSHRAMRANESGLAALQSKEPDADETQA